MTPIRTQIREALLARLRRCASLKGQVFDTPLQAFLPEQLPVLILTLETDQILEDWSSILVMALANQIVQMHALSITLKVIIKESASVIQTLEEITRDVLAKLLGDATLDGLCKDIRCQEISDMTVSEEREIPIRSISIHAVVWYRVIESIWNQPVN